MNKPTLSQSIAGFLKLIRYKNLLIIVLTQYMTRIFLIGPPENYQSYIFDFKLAALSFSTVCIAAAGYIINDYFDIKIDLINKPEEVIIGRLVKRRWAIILHQILNATGILIGLWLSLKIFLLDFFAVSFLWFYSERYKRQAFIGNVLVAFLTALSLIVVGIYFKKHQTEVYIYALFAFSISLIREIIKDMEDIRGDARHGCRTLPIIWGFRRTKILLYIFISSFVIILFSMAYSLQNTKLTIVFLVLMLPISWLTAKIYRADKKRDFGKLSAICKAIMLIGVASMVFI
ncbi:MAG: geranylgeranylglycerol-phosphate geranylgeranyltransferase [Spirosomaceae bacterium]|jgi:4-hydroxybenzoate polyprenyltransferase|nr:geranylgeranylglycerol-phosphate geranylgeranyltransferase [Spirosomataceae bacterium]